MPVFLCLSRLQLHFKHTFCVCGDKFPVNHYVMAWIGFGC